MVYFELAENHLAGASLKRDAARVAQRAEVIAEGPAIDSRASSLSPRNGRFGCRHFRLRPFLRQGEPNTDGAERVDVSRWANTAKTWVGKYGSFRARSEDGDMMEPKLEVPAELRELAEKTIDQAEKAFGMFFDAANKSITSVPSPGTEMSKQALSLTEQNMKAAFEHARKLVHATDLQEAMRIQSEFLKSQFTNAGEHMRQITGGVLSAAKDASKGKF
jgi:phasin